MLFAWREFLVRARVGAKSLDEPPSAAVDSAGGHHSSIVVVVVVVAKCQLDDFPLKSMSPPRGLVFMNLGMATMSLPDKVLEAFVA